MNEEWKPVQGLESLYRVSNKGRVASADRVVTCKNGRSYDKAGRLLRPVPVGKYKGIVLCDGKGNRKRVYIHRLVAYHFIGDPPEGKELINHKNGDRWDNTAANLEWVNHKENMLHASKEGLLACGEKNGNCIYSDAVVRDIRRLFDTGHYTQREIGRKLNVSEIQVSRIVRNKARKNVI